MDYGYTNYVVLGILQFTACSLLGIDKHGLTSLLVR